MENLASVVVANAINIAAWNLLHISTEFTADPFDRHDGRGEAPAIRLLRQLAAAALAPFPPQVLCQGHLVIQMHSSGRVPIELPKPLKSGSISTSLPFATNYNIAYLERSQRKGLSQTYLRPVCK